MIVFVYPFIFLIVMVGLVIWLERYAKHVAKNNDEVIWHTDWLSRAGMFETRHIIDGRWKYKW